MYTDENASHEPFMRRAIELARHASGDTHPNPLVGAVIVEDGKIVAEGFHTRAGAPHAEPAALTALGRAPAPGATLYVTLEPCCTHGRTPPCTGAIIAAGIRHVVVGATDPNPAHAGHGYEVLRAAGVEVIVGVLAGECADLNMIFNHAMVKRSPLFALKTAATLDGRTATRAGESQWITGPESRAEVMALRRMFPAVGIGSGTAIADNPRLTSRLPEGVRCPWRLVVDRTGRLADHPELHLFSDTHRERTVVVTAESCPAAIREKITAFGVAVWTLPAADDAGFFSALKTRCFEEGITGVLWEPGATLAGAMLGAEAADYLYHFAAPALFADNTARGVADGPARPRLADTIRLREVRRSLHGYDLLTRGHLVYS